MAFGVASAFELPAEWTNKFDLVHQRLLIAAFKYNEWAVAVNEIFRVNKPGGFAELCETNVFNWLRASQPETSRHQKADQAGFVDIHEEVRSVKFGPAGGEDGRRFFLILDGVARGYGGPLAIAGGLAFVNNQDEWEELIDKVEEEWESEEGSNAELSWYIFTARKHA